MMLYNFSNLEFMKEDAVALHTYLGYVICSHKLAFH